MRLFNFVLGVFGAILAIASFLYFFPLVFIGGLATGSITTAFGLPILLMVLGVVMTNFGFYYKRSSKKGNYQLINLAKWGIICAIGVFISNFLIGKLMIFNNFFVILFTAFIISVIIQLVRSHNHEDFKMKWFIFYFLVYSNVLWIIHEHVVSSVFFQSGFFTSIVIGFIIGGLIVILQSMNLKSNSIPWASFVLVLVLIVANLGYLQEFNSENLTLRYKNDSGLSEDKLACPSTINSLPVRKLSPLELNTLIKTNVWRIENNFGPCYLGKYEGQHPEKYYCDDMIVSRWDTSSSGTINYRWYTAITTEWKFEESGSQSMYVLEDFSCENGKKVTVKKETRAYYVHVSRDGREIKIEY